MRVRRGRWLLLIGAAGLACGDSAYAPTPAALVGEYSVQAGTGFGTYELALALETVADSVHGVWRLSWQATCSTEDGALEGTLVGDRLNLRLLSDQEFEGTYALRLRVERGDSTLPGTIAAEVTNGTTGCVVQPGSVVTLRRGDVVAFP
jgi:hypothetical protein